MYENHNFGPLCFSPFAFSVLLGNFDLVNGDMSCHHFSDSNSSSIKALFQLHTILPTNSNISHHLTHLKSLVNSLQSSKPSLKSFITRPISSHSITKTSAAIESELQSWIDSETVTTLSCLVSDNNNENEDELLQPRVTTTRSQSQTILFARVASHRIREHAGFAISALIRFNKDVFVGEVLMNPTVEALIDIGSVLDEIESNGEITKVIALLNSYNMKLSLLAMECVLEIGYFGRKEAVEGMLKHKLGIKKLQI
ncbi:hypothetical protein MTR_4g014150 [Medicago truncatula]|uniref:Uncharacterized protein n=1 Tax=Medicago truncatula TaxID=3880 RepID=G7JKM0_MEDTR|nr:hypothetical protein MTR_4g014150 [Medicago truncatula]